MSDRQHSPRNPHRVDHRSLLAKSRRVRDLASWGDQTQLRQEMDDFVTEVLLHLDEERALVERLSSFTGRLLRRGQERIVDRLLELDIEARGLGDDSCDCMKLATEVDVLLKLQAEDERRARIAVSQGVRRGTTTSL